MTRKAKAKEPFKGGMPRFVPTDEDRALVKLLIAHGFPQHVVCQYISNRRGSHISESILKRAFAHELKVGKADLDTMCLRSSWQRSCGASAGRSLRTWISARGGLSAVDGGRGHMRLPLVVLSQRLPASVICPRCSSLFSSSNPIPRCGNPA